MDCADLVELEKKLLGPLSRKDLVLFSELLSDTFIEFGTSGRIYDKKITLERLSNEDSITREAFDFSSVLLAPDIVQLRFKTRSKAEDGSIVTSLRSSIWKKNGLSWKLLFHQGTQTDL